MEPLKVNNSYKKIARLVYEGRLRESLKKMKEFVKPAGRSDYITQIETLESTYRSMISYTVKGVHDPERKKIYTKLQQSVMKLADQAKEDLLSSHSGWHTYWLKSNCENERKLAGKTLVESIDDLIFKSELDEWLTESGTRWSDPVTDRHTRHRKLIEDIFNHLWLTDYYGEAEDQLIQITLHDNKFEWYEKALFVSAVTLSTLRVWEEKKIRKLISLFIEGEEKIRERALAGLVLSLYYYDRRLSLHPELSALLEQTFSDKGAHELMRITIIQLLRSRETERIGRKLQEEILPKVAGLKPRIEEKLDLDNLLPADLTEGKNPDWSDLFEESEDIYKSMEEFSKLQMEGADVYMSAFANLKNFDFFRTFSNWFLPFYPDHESLDNIFRDEILGEGTNELAEALYKTPFICNSDKYSLVINLKHLPDSQKKMMLKVFRMELEGLEQMRDTEIDLDPNLTFRTNITQYLQDLYRFFKLSPYKNEFEDLFRGNLEIHNTGFFKLVFSSSGDRLTLADYYFGKDFYNEALDLYNSITDEESERSQVYEKAGYCLQQQGLFTEAITKYRRANILERKAWTLKKIGYCYRRLEMYEEALENYLEAETAEKDNMHTVAMIGHCYLDLKRYEDALKYYFRVEYHDPGNYRVLKPIAWCYFVAGKFEDSRKYYNKLSDENLKAHDYINIGHLALCTGERDLAVASYRKSITKGNLPGEELIEIFREDSGLLASLGADPDDLPIIADFLIYDSGLPE